MDTPIGAINAPVAVLDIKFVSTIHINNMAASIVKGFVPTNPKTNCAIIGPAPVFSNAIPRDKVPTNNNIVDISIAFNASLPVIVLVTTREIAPIQANT